MKYFCSNCGSAQKELLRHQDLQLAQSKEIARLKALCQEPVVLTLNDVDIAETPHEYDAVVLAITLINKKLKERK